MKFDRTRDVSTTLSKRNLLKDSHINIKPYMTQSERHTESLVLKERRHLSNSVIDKKMLKVSCNRLYQGARVIGEVLGNVCKAADTSQQEDASCITNTMTQQTPPLKTTQVQASSSLPAEVATTAKPEPSSTREVTADGNALPVANSSYCLNHKSSLQHSITYCKSPDVVAIQELG